MAAPDKKLRPPRTKYFPGPNISLQYFLSNIIDTITSGHGIGNGWFARDFRIQSALFAESAKTLPNSSEGIDTSKEKTFIQINEGDVGMTIVTGQKKDETRTE